MGLENRPYWREDVGAPRGLTVGVPRPGPVVTAMLIANLAVFVAQAFLDRPTREHRFGAMSELLGVTVAGFWQLWRYVTFQFLHGDYWHILLNMLGVYMLGGPLEHRWGSRRFLAFYLTCGAAAGVAYVLIGLGFDLHPFVPIIGASGAVYGIVLACAALFPHFQIILLFFPVPIRLAAILIFGGMALLVLQALGEGAVGAAMSDVAHLGGAVAAAGWIWGVPSVRTMRRQAVGKAERGAWERKMREGAEEEAEIDRILRKIHDHGLNSLTRAEKELLQDATRREREEERQVRRT
jgi:membrane associated rhomboid family serine protease